MRILLLTFLYPFFIAAQEFPAIETIMKGSEFIGHLPANIRWNAEGDKILFDKKIKGGEEIHLSYAFKRKTFDTVKVENIVNVPDRPLNWMDRDRYYIAEKGHLISVKDQSIKEKTIVLTERIFNIQHVKRPEVVYFQMGNSLYRFNRNKVQLVQITKIKSKESQSQDETYLSKQEKQLFKRRNTISNQTDTENIISINTHHKQISSIQISPDESYIFYRLSQQSDPEYTEIMNYINEDGVSKTTKARPKVGHVTPPDMIYKMYDLNNQKTITLTFDSLPGMRKAPEYFEDYDRSKTLKANKPVIIHDPVFNPTGDLALFSIKSFDNKDRWLVSYDMTTGDSKTIDHQHDKAWIGGPGISGWNFYSGNIGWINDYTIYFQSEKTGFSHLYSYELKSDDEIPLTTGQWEVHDVKLSKSRKAFYITTNKSHPGNRSFYRLDIHDKKLTPILTKDGNHEVTLSPDEKWLAIRYSYKNQPWELYYAKNERNAEMHQITHSTTKSFESYAWKAPAIIKIPTEKGNQSYARIYRPDEHKKNGAAIIFVHGAGYLQNAHNYWSDYYREFMFHNLLTSLGYTVLDIDYRASKGYGRDHRTAIYRHMGEADLADQLYGKDWLIKNESIDSDRVGIYGGSYGGFITLMALLKHPGTFKCGGALRSVTDWAHYNHPYTSNILNTPELDSLAYQRSSPIYYADGLEDRLIMFHGMMDDNVQYQDVVRLSQRFIEMGKENWNLVGYPIEPHSFRTADAWTDEYRRLLKMFNEELLE